MPEHEDPRKGFLLRDVGYVEKKSVLSTYSFADDGVLTITTRYDTNVGTERCWFVTDQVRMRVSSVQCLDGVSMTTYCTELRCPSDDDIKAMADKAQQPVALQQCWNNITMFDPFLKELHQGIKERGAVPVEVPMDLSTINHPNALAPSRAGFGTCLAFGGGASPGWMPATACRFSIQLPIPSTPTTIH